MTTDHIVFPGEIISSELEALPGNGVKSIDGNICSLIVGKSSIKDKKANVNGFKPLQKIVSYSDVIGMVMDIIDPVAIVAIKPLGQNIADKGDVGILHVSNVSERYLPSIKNAVKVGDIILAKVIEINKSITLSIKGPKYGVISAFNKSRKSLMIRISYDKVKCPNSDVIETRKLSQYYGKHEEVLKWLKV